jgi:hypothetical protein
MFDSLDEWLTRSIFLFLNPIELIRMECVCLFWKNNVDFCWKLVKDLPQFNYCTYKPRHDIPLKVLCAKVWKSKTYEGSLCLLGGSRDESNTVANFAFKDSNIFTAIESNLVDFGETLSSMTCAMNVSYCPICFC